MSGKQTKSSPWSEELDGTEAEKFGFYIKEVFNKCIMLNFEL
jgi:hypothetical protein